MTSEILTVRPGIGAQAKTVATVVASLPKALRLDVDGQLMSIDGTGDWCAGALTAISDGVRGLVINRPVGTSADAIEELVGVALARGVSVVVRGCWSAHATVADLRPVSARCEDAVLVDCFASGTIGGSWDPLLDQLLLVGKLFGPLERLTCDHRSPSGHMWRAQTVDRHLPVSLGWASDSLSPSVELRLLGRGTFVEAIIEDTCRWLPVSALNADDTGEYHRPRTYESADRAIWRRLYDAVRHGAVDVGDLELLAVSIRQIDRATELVTARSVPAFVPANQV